MVAKWGKCKKNLLFLQKWPIGYTHVGTKYIKRPWDFENILEFWSTLLYRLSLFPGTKVNFCQTTFSQTGGFIRGLWSVWIFLHVVGCNSKIWLNFWKLVEILKLGQNSEMGLKFCNLIKSLKFVEDDEEDLQLLNYHEKL